jgi:DNA polymerase-4
MRHIIHINIADFAVAVERVINRGLTDRPVIIAPEGAVRAAVYDMSEEAYQAGVRKGMPLRRARRLVPGAQILPPHPDRYERAMADVFKQALPYSPLIEPGEDDGHLFVDVSGTSRLFGPPADVAWRLRREMRRALDLTPIWSLAANKLTAKVASRLVKPLGEHQVAAGSEATFLAPLPIWLFPGIEQTDLLSLRDFNFTTAAEITALTADQLTVILGSRAAFVREILRGIDEAPVLPAGQRPPQIGLGHEFGTDTNEMHIIEGALFNLVEQAGLRLRRTRRAARRLVVRVTYADGRRRSRQAAARPATANDLTLFESAKKALDLALSRRVRLRHLQLVVGGLVYPPAQRPLFAAEREELDRREALIGSLDRIRGRFGRQAIGFGRSVSQCASEPVDTSACSAA